MDFALGDDQGLLRDLAVRLFERESSIERVRQVEPEGHDPGLWQRLIDTGLATIALRPDAGGGTGELLDAAFVIFEQGRFLATVPIAEAAVATRLLARCGSQQRLLDRVTGGSLVPTLCPRPADGTAPLVPAGAVAGLIVALDGDELVAVEGPVPGPVSPGPLGRLPVADRALRGTGVTERLVLAGGSEAADLFAAAVDEWKALVAVLLAGAGRAALDLAVRYVGERRQFNAPIGSFQAVAHRLADVATEIEAARLVGFEAAWVADHDPMHRATSAAIAYGIASEASQRAAAESLHFHGGYGFMLEYDIQLYYRRIKAWILSTGDPEREFARIAAEPAVEP